VEDGQEDGEVGFTFGVGIWAYFEIGDEYMVRIASK
jgi:hypothetical protein